LDEQLKNDFKLKVLRTPVRAPKANAYCERLVGTVRRECLDFMIPLNERHLRMTLRSWVTHYNKGRPHSSLGPGIPETALGGRLRRPRIHGHRLPRDCEIRARDILGGLHHEYGWNSAQPEAVAGFCGGQVLDGKINPGKVFDLTLPLAQVAEGYRAMDERRAIKTLLQPNGRS
jgi:Integrase core domain